jgi:hypothetical protein
MTEYYTYNPKPPEDNRLLLWGAIAIILWVLIATLTSCKTTKDLTKTYEQSKTEKQTSEEVNQKNDITTNSELSLVKNTQMVEVVDTMVNVSVQVEPNKVVIVRLPVKITRTTNTQEYSKKKETIVDKGQKFTSKSTSDKAETKSGSKVLHKSTTIQWYYYLIIAVVLIAIAYVLYRKYGKRILTYLKSKL